MPPQAKGRRGQLKPDLPPGNTPQLPQEIIEAIIDEFDASMTDENDWTVFPDRKALRSCALVGRAFVRPSQMKLFARVMIYDTQSPDERTRLFSKLLSFAPHVGHYVKTLVLAHRCGRSASVEHVLSSLPSLKTLALYALRRSAVEPLATGLGDSLRVAFSLSSLRRLMLRDHQFPDALALQSMLSNSIGLEELVLVLVSFANTSVVLNPAARQEPPRVVLKSLKLGGMPIDRIEAVLNAFTVVDIRHLSSLGCGNHYYEPLVRANARSLQELTLEVSHNRAQYYPETLLLPEGLHRLNLTIDRCHTLPPFIRQLENLATLKNLKRISITVPSGPEAYGPETDCWSEIDSLLAGIDSELLELRLNLNTFPRSVAAPKSQAIEQIMRTSMPTMNGKGILRLSFASPYSTPEY
ncbi:hypothetical protein B0H13DRAFT_183952 [Mycena leptocephala]|nr:hypothetical protein B0H13DRAFT_183952 [Mycena leptocephala]